MSKARLVGAGAYYHISDALGSTRQVWKQGDATPVFSVSTHKPLGELVRADVQIPSGR